MENHDFGGWATVANRKCSDGRTITPEAFKHMDQKTVPLVWQHGHDNVNNVLGHAILQHRENGIYAYCFFNKTDSGTNAKRLVEHGDIDSLSIHANQLVEKNKTVLHGQINEVSLVLSGANPDARIDYIRIEHGDGFDETSEDEAIIYSGQQELVHAGTLQHKTFQEVYDTLSEEQVGLVEMMVKQALEQGSVEHSATGDDKGNATDTDDTSADTDQEQSASDDKDPEDKGTEGTMTHHNVFENGANGTLQHSGMTGDGTRDGRPTLTHAQIKTIWDDGKKMGSFKESLLKHAGEYGITNIEVLFPDARTIDQRPEWITRRQEWVEGVLNGTDKQPFSRIKTMSADLTLDSARAKGYVKATMKKEQFFAISQRETTPKTIYKKQKLDRDDIVDITDFDIVAWLWVEMRFMLREEVARAILIGDGREVDDPDKIDETKIRPIAYDDTFYTDVVVVPANTGPSDLVEAVLRARNNYLGTAPKAYMTNAVMTDMLLEKDRMGRRLYRNKQELASELGVQEIVEVPVMDGAQRDGGEILMIIVNLSDYAVGATKGGEITEFTDFDIDYNQEKYLIETRLSGALKKHKRAQVILRGAGTLATPSVPTFNSTTGVVTIPTVTGVVYKNAETGTTLTAGAQTAIAAGTSVEIEAVPASGYYFPHNFDNDWQFTRLP